MSCIVLKKTKVIENVDLDIEDGEFAVFVAYNCHLFDERNQAFPRIIDGAAETKPILN